MEDYRRCLDDPIRTLDELEYWLEGRRKALGDGIFEINAEDVVINSVYPLREREESEVFTQFTSPDRIGLRVRLPSRKSFIVRATLGIVGNSKDDYVVCYVTAEAGGATEEAQRIDDDLLKSMKERVAGAIKKLEEKGYAVSLSPSDVGLSLQGRGKKGMEELTLVLSNQVTQSNVFDRVANQLSIIRGARLEFESEKENFQPFENTVSTFSYKSDPQIKAKAFSVGWREVGNTIRTADLLLFEQKRLQLLEVEGVGDAESIPFELFSGQSSLENTKRFVVGIQKNLQNRLKQLEDLSKKVDDSKSKKEYLEDVSFIEREIKLLEAGINHLGNDEKALKSFRLLNRSMELRAKEKGSKVTGWRPYQLSFLLSAISDHLEDTGAVVTLNLPTGLGKTEAFLGLSLFVVFHDRLNGKKIGTSAVIKYPRKFLSAQQLKRSLEVIAFANIAYSEVAKSIEEGDLISTGILMSKQDTPNGIYGFIPSGNQGGKYGFQKGFLEYANKKRNRLVDIKNCPFCDGEINTIPSKERHRILFICKNNGCQSHGLKSVFERETGEIPLYVTDEEVFRYLPSILIMTVDKFATFSRQQNVKKLFNPNVLRFSQGYGFFFRETMLAKGERPTPAELLSNAKICDGSAYGATPPSLLVVDEIHLVSGSYASIAAPYETMFLELCGKRKKPLVICSSATVNNSKVGKSRLYQKHLNQLFGIGINKIRLFPADVFSYVKEMKDTQRYLCALMPKEKSNIFAIERSTEFLTRKIRERKEISPMESSILNYFTSKDNLARVYLSIQQRVLTDRLKLRPSGDYETFRVTADDPDEVTKFQNVMYGLEEKVDSKPSVQVPNNSYYLTYATSTIANGIDFSALNMMQFFGFPGMISEYVQARSRIARGKGSHGLSLMILSNYHEREASFFSSFKETHRNTDFLLEPSPINRDTKEVFENVIPGLFHLILFVEKDIDPETKIYTPKKVLDILRDRDQVEEIKKKMSKIIHTKESEKDFDEVFDLFIKFYHQVLEENVGQRAFTVFQLGVELTRNMGKIQNLQQTGQYNHSVYSQIDSIRQRMEKQEGLVERGLNFPSLMGLTSLRDVSDTILLKFGPDQIPLLKELSGVSGRFQNATDESDLSERAETGEGEDVSEKSN